MKFINHYWLNEVFLKNQLLISEKSENSEIS